MFGKTSRTGAAQFVMQRGKAVGNLKGPKAPPVIKNGGGKKPLPKQNAVSKAGVKGRDSAGNAGRIDQSRG